MNDFIFTLIKQDDIIKKNTNTKIIYFNLLNKNPNSSKFSKYDVIFYGLELDLDKNSIIYNFGIKLCMFDTIFENIIQITEEF